MSTAVLKGWFPWTNTPFVALAPMYPYADAGLATAVTSAGGLGQYLSSKFCTLPVLIVLCYIVA